MSQRGRASKTYIDTAGNWDNPTWVEVKKVIDETITPSAEMATGGSRESIWEDNQPASQRFEWNCTYRYPRGNDTVYQAFLNAFMYQSTVNMLFLDNVVTTTGAKGWKAPMRVDQLPVTRNLGDLVEATVNGVACLDFDGATIRTAVPYVVNGGEQTITTTTAEPTTTTS